MTQLPRGIALVALVLIGCAQPSDEQAPQEQVTQRIPQFENENVEVWKSIIMPNQPLSMHRHDNARAIIALRGGTLTVTNQAGDSHDMTWETGSAYWLEADTPGELHGDVNEGTEPVEVIVVQLKGDGGG
jgi:quercetin dioxygenase-like cupin family protein